MLHIITPRSRLLLLASLSILYIATSAPAQAPLEKGSLVILRIPNAVFTQKVVWSGFFPRAPLTATIRQPDKSAGVTVNDNPDWLAAGFPSLIERKITGIKIDKGKGTAEVTLKAKGEFDIKLTLFGDAQGEFSMIAAPTSAREEVRKESYEALAAKFFTGSLSAIPADRKIELLRFVDETANAAHFGSVTFKDNQYLEIDLGIDTNEYNDLRLNQAQRIATVINNRLLTLLKAFAKPVRDVPQIYGLKLSIKLFHRDFLSGPFQFDQVEIYLPTDSILKFANADITNQQLIDLATVIVNDNRIQVLLSQ